MLCRAHADDRRTNQEDRVTCHCCTAARETANAYRTFDPACLWCGARLIQCLGKLRQLPIHITQRRREALKVWMEQGHKESELRELAAGPPAFQPVTGRRGK